MAQPEQLSRREAIKRFVNTTAKVSTVAAGGGVVGYWLGGEAMRVGLNHPGDLTRDLLVKLERGTFTLVHRPNGETVESMRNADVAIDPFPLSEEQARIEQAVSQHDWMAINPLKLVLGKGGEDFKALEKLVTSESTSQQKRLGSDIEVVSGEVIDWVGLDHAYHLRPDGGDLITEGIILMTGTKVGDNVVGISREVSGGPLEFRVIDVSAPPPDGLRAAGLVVPKPPASS